MPGKNRKHGLLKDPEGGLTAAGRAHFHETEGANLKPGVKSVKSPTDMKRKGSFLRRHYGKQTIPPLKDEKGEPTRFAKQAAAWGEPVPTTQAAVQKLARKGSALLDRYHRAVESKKGPAAKAPPARKGRISKAAGSKGRRRS